MDIPSGWRVIEIDYENDIEKSALQKFNLGTNDSQNA